MKINERYTLKKVLGVGTFICLIILLFCLGCKNESKKRIPAFEQNKVSNIGAEFSFIDSVQSIQINKRPSHFSAYNNDYGIVITKQRFTSLNLEQVFGLFNPNQHYTIRYKLNLSENFQTYVIGNYGTETSSLTYLITYNSSFEVADYILVAYYERDDKTNISTYLVFDKLYIENSLLDISTEYFINSEGRIAKTNRPVTFKHYKYRDKINFDLRDLTQQTVKSRNGAIIRDSLNNPIGKLAFGETVYIVDYTRDSVVVEYEGKLIKGVKARTVVHRDDVKLGNDFYIEPSNLGYVFTGFLYNTQTIYNEVDALYAYSNLRIGIGDDESLADLRELIDIKKVNLNTYKSRIIKSSTSATIDTLLKKNGQTKLKFENGKSLILKDTTYRSEYNPTRSYNVSYHPDFENAYLVNESMFFTDDIYSVISKKTGDTIQQFQGYPYLSPNKTNCVSVYTEFECMQQTFLSVKNLVDNKYVNYVTLLVESWSYPFKLNSNKQFVDDFNIYWLSDDEFIIRAKNPEECYLTKDIVSFYLKYKIK